MKFIEFNQINRLKLAVESASRRLNELKITPGTLNKFAASAASDRVVAGFEAELIFRDINRGYSDPEPDYSEDRYISSINQIIEFFSYDGNMSSREQERARTKLEEEYTEYCDKHMSEYIANNVKQTVRELISGEIDKNEAIADILASYKLDQRAINTALRQETRSDVYNRALQDYYHNIYTLADMSIKDENDYYDQAVDLLTDQYEYPSEEEWTTDIGVDRMSTAEEYWGFTWPFYYYPGAGADGYDTVIAEGLAEELQKVIGQKVSVGYKYHDVPRSANRWIIEPDSSIDADDEETDMPAEIVSPPLPLNDMLDKMQKVFTWAIKNNAYTNDSTGLHIGVSLVNQGGDVDIVKLALFSGDSHILKQFGREANRYAANFIEAIKGKIDTPVANRLISMLKDNLHRKASDAISEYRGKYVSINARGDYIEFRSPGGENYEKDFDKVKETVLRYAQAMMIAADPNAAKQEYLKKFYQLIASAFSNTTTLDLFAKLATGQITAEQFKSQWANTVIAQADAAQNVANNWAVVNRATNEIVKTYSETSRGLAVNTAHSELAPELSRPEFLAKFTVVPQDKFTNSPRLKTALRIAK